MYSLMTMCSYIVANAMAQSCTILNRLKDIQQPPKVLQPKNINERIRPKTVGGIISHSK